jgi:hypothetical protein
MIIIRPAHVLHVLLLKPHKVRNILPQSVMGGCGSECADEQLIDAVMAASSHCLLPSMAYHRTNATSGLVRHYIFLYRCVTMCT